jgi:hypothetical protein
VRENNFWLNKMSRAAEERGEKVRKRFSGQQVPEVQKTSPPGARKDYEKYSVEPSAEYLS